MMMMMMFCQRRGQCHKHNRYMGMVYVSRYRSLGGIRGEFGPKLKLTQVLILCGTFWRITRSWLTSYRILLSAKLLKRMTTSFAFIRYLFSLFSFSLFSMLWQAAVPVCFSILLFVKDSFYRITIHPQRLCFHIIIHFLLLRRVCLIFFISRIFIPVNWLNS